MTGEHGRDDEHESVDKAGTVVAKVAACRPASVLRDNWSNCRSTHRACYHRRPSLPGGCCICLEQSAGDSTFIAVTPSLPVFRSRLKSELFARSYSCTD